MRIKDSEQECTANSTLVSLFAKRISPGRCAQKQRLRSKGHGKLSIHYCADQATIETVFHGHTIENVFRTIFPSISPVSSEQSQMCVKNVILAMIEQGDLLWRNNLTHFSRQQPD